MLKPGGLFFFTCGGSGRVEHGTRRTTPTFCGEDTGTMVTYVRATIAQVEAANSAPAAIYKSATITGTATTGIRNTST